ncbi:unnamed protein product [Acanthosepion pharaonis]|uniref:Uncharacterized protein n=1 Tax=Acanthosepion pharaonis TaxID=158019 RepID=A0A812BHQ8_ACAPH|nr:unnamed protein product [Sepia pharaonis]
MHFIVSIRLIYVILCVRIPVMYADLCVRILVLCMWVYASASPCYAFVSIRLIYVILYVRIPVIMYADLCVRILVSYVCGLCIHILMHLCLYSLIYVILCVGSLLCMRTYASRILVSYVCGSMHPDPLVMHFVSYTVNICDSMRPDPCYVCGPYASVFLSYVCGSMYPHPCYAFVSIRLIYVILYVRIPIYVCGTYASRILVLCMCGLCIRIPLLCICVYTVNICDSMRPDPCYVCGPMHPYSCLMYVGLCIRIPLLCICVYTVNMYSMRRIPVCMWTYASIFLSYVCGSVHPDPLVMHLCLYGYLYVILCVGSLLCMWTCVRILVLCMGLCICIPLLCICVYMVNICDSIRPDPCYVCGPMRPYSCLMYVGLCIVSLLCICVYTVNICDSVVGSLLCMDLCVRILVLCMWSASASVSP